jgi:hypothetical protein
MRHRNPSLVADDPARTRDGRRSDQTGLTKETESTPKYFDKAPMFFWVNSRLPIIILTHFPYAIHSRLDSYPELASDKADYRITSH